MAHKISVLLVEDEKNICDFISTSLVSHNYRVTEAHSGQEALPLITSQCPDLILLDLGLPDMDGMDIIRQVRTWASIPIIVISARTQEQEKVAALDMGADDYLTKPFSINELMARVNSLIRRYTLLNPVSSPETDCMTFQGMTIDSLNRLVFQGNEQIELTGKEFDLLSFLASNKGKVFTKKQIYTQVWAEEYAFDDSNIMSFISKLRKKIEPDPEHPFYILTVRGVGYRFNREA